MTDFESTIERLLVESVNAELGPRRPAPQLDLPATAPTRRGLRPWLMPVLATAGIAAATAAVVVPVHLLADRGGPPGPATGEVASPTHSITPPPPVPSDPTRLPPTPSIPSPAASSVDLGGATLRLPVGWVAREVADPHQYGSSVYGREWCLAPAGPAGDARADCPLQFGPAADASVSGVPVNFNVPLGTPPGGVRSSCPVTRFYGQTGWSLHTFGLRNYYDREWYGHCSDGTPRWIEQYVVNTAPGYVLFSDQMTPELAGAMAEIAQHASVPARTGPLLLYDTGVVRAVTRQANGYLMTIAPIAKVDATRWRLTGDPTRRYPIAPDLLKHATVGTQVGVVTDGTKVTSIGAPVSAE